MLMNDVAEDNNVTDPLDRLILLHYCTVSGPEILGDVQDNISLRIEQEC